MTDRISADDAALAEALESANLPALVPALAQLTGDLSLLRGRVRPVPGTLGDVEGGIAEADQAEIRAAALEILKRFRDQQPPLPSLPSDEALREMMCWCAGEDVPEAYLPLVLEETQLAGQDLRRFEWERRPSDDVLQAFHVVIVGAGLSGVCAAIRLEEAGIPYTIVDKNDNVGGTWLENTYPDLRVDVPNHFYSFSFEPSSEWSHFYARRDELEQYVERCADKYGIRPKIRFNTEVVSARYDERSARWKVGVRREDGSEEALGANAVISAVGMLNRPQYPEIKGLDRFEGPAFHSARWEHEHDLSGKRVAVIGTGASAMQFVPVLAQHVERLIIFQRSPQWALNNPSYHQTVTEGKKWLLRHVPYYANWYRFLLFWNGSDRMYNAFCLDPSWDQADVSMNAMNHELRRLNTEYIMEQVGHDPELIAKCVPDYPPLGKRMLMDNGWFRTLTRRNVDLVTDAIREVTRDAVVTENGDSHGVDAIVVATGFYAGKFLWPMEIAGRSGVKLHDVWDAGENPRAYLGITMPDFPNLFCMYGPNTNPVVGSVIFMIECQTRYIMGCLRELLEKGLSSIECRREVHDAYNERVDAEHEKMVWRHPRVHSYYNNRKGRVTTNVPWRLFDYWEMTRAPDPSDFILS